MNLKGKNVLVTGIASNRSISFAIAKILHENGANVIAAYQNERLRDRVVKLLQELNIDAILINATYLVMRRLCL